MKRLKVTATDVTISKCLKCMTFAETVYTTFMLPFLVHFGDKTRP